MYKAAAVKTSVRLVAKVWKYRKLFQWIYTVFLDDGKLMLVQVDGKLLTPIKIKFQ